MEKYFSVGNAKLQTMDKMMDKLWKTKSMFPTTYRTFCPQPSASITKLQITFPQAPQLRLLLFMLFQKPKRKRFKQGGKGLNTRLSKSYKAL
jgi:hypothetical protein